jgi:hypothetical protein
MDCRVEPGNDAEFVSAVLSALLPRLLLAALVLLVGLLILLAALMLLVGLHAAALLLLARFVLAGILIGSVRIGHTHLLEGLPRPDK